MEKTENNVDVDWKTLALDVLHETGEFEEWFGAPWGLSDDQLAIVLDAFKRRYPQSNLVRELKVDFGVRDVNGRIPLSPNDTQWSLTSVGVRKGDYVMLSDGEIRVIGRIDDGESGLVATPLGLFGFWI